MFKIFSTDICWINIKWGIWRVILRPSYIWDARFLKVKRLMNKAATDGAERYNNLFIYKFFCDATAQIGPRSLHSWYFWVTHTHEHSHPVELLWTSDQLFAQAATYKTHNRHQRLTSMSSAGFQSANPEIKQLQTSAFDGTSTGIGD